MTRSDCTASETGPFRTVAAQRLTGTSSRALVTTPIRWLPLLLLCFLGISVAQAAPDLCQRDTACRQLSEQAATAYREQRYYDAFRLLKHAYASSQEPRLLVNLARCMERLGLREDAVAAYERFLAEDTVFDPAERARVQRFIDEARAAPRPQWDGTGTATNPPAASTDPPVAETGHAPSGSAPQMKPVPDSPPTLPAQAQAAAMASVKSKDAATAQTPAVVGANDIRPRTRPVYKNPWLWVGIGGGVAAIAIAVGIAAGTQRTPAYYVVEWP